MYGYIFPAYFSNLLLRFMSMPKQTFIFTFIVTVLVSVVHSANAQNIDSLLIIQREADPQEKMYVHFDKNYYNPGETIWFKAYLFAGLDLSDKSKNFYAELINDNGYIIDRKTAPIKGAGAFSSFDLSPGITSPQVYFRAYTINMLNSDTAFLYVKTIPIILPSVAAKVKPAALVPSVIRFLPEGGDWVAGLNSSIAFKITGAGEMPVEATGYVQDNDGVKVTDFLTRLNGMGQLAITPLAGKTYTAIWKDESGKSYTTPLPPFKQKGIVLQVRDDAAGKRFTIQRTDEVDEAEKQLHMVAYMNQHLVFSANINLQNKKSSIGVLPVKDLPSGILQITIFNQQYKPLAERITFVNNHDYEFDGDAWIPQKSITRRGLNKGEVMIADTLLANLSISITDADLNDADTYQDNIISRLMLTGDLRGKIVNPYYYFFSTSDSVPYHMDLVMLTHGWRRYNWDNVLAGKHATGVWKESNYLSLDGQVAGTLPGGFAPGTQLTGIMKTTDSVTQIINLPVSRKGKVFTDGMIFYDQAKLFFQFSDKKMQFDKSMLTVTNGLRNGYKIARLDSNLRMMAMMPDADIIAKNIKNNEAELRLAEYRNRKATELQNVTVTAKVKSTVEKMDAKYASGLFTGDAKSFDVTTDPSAMGAQSVFQYLQGRVAGLQINASQNPPTMSWRGGNPALYLNEMQADAQQLSNTPMSDVAYIKVFSPGQTGAISNSGGGAIVVYTRKGGDMNTSDIKGLDYLQLTGYSPVKQFYIPDYATTANDDADLRTTLYWNPDIILNKSRKRFKFQFYNSDITRHFRLVMEGVNEEGRLIHIEKLIQ